MTDGQINEVAQYMSVIKVYGNVPVYFNKYGERIQDWDEYGKANAHRTEIQDGLAFVALGSDEQQAMDAVGRYKAAGGHVSRIEVVQNEL